jgi:hypothetical protein
MGRISTLVVILKNRGKGEIKEWEKRSTSEKKEYEIYR